MVYLSLDDIAIWLPTQSPFFFMLSCLKRSGGPPCFRWAKLRTEAGIERGGEDDRRDAFRWRTSLRICSFVQQCCLTHSLPMRSRIAAIGGNFGSIKKTLESTCVTTPSSSVVFTLTNTSLTSEKWTKMVPWNRSIRLRTSRDAKPLTHEWVGA